MTSPPGPLSLTGEREERMRIRECRCGLQTKHDLTGEGEKGRKNGSAEEKVFGDYAQCSSEC